MRGSRSLAPIFCLVALEIVSAVVYLRAGNGTTFSNDEWRFILYRLDWNASTFFSPHNDHLSMAPIAIYKLLFETVGLAHHWVYRVVAVALHLTVGTLVFALARRRIGDIAAVAVAAVVLFPGPGVEDVVWAFQIGFLLSIACGLGMLLALERDRRALTCALLAVSIASSGIGIAFGAACLVAVLCRPDRWRLLWIPLAPIAAAVLWSVSYGNSDAQLSNVFGAPSYVLHVATSALQAPLGNDSILAYAVVVAIAGLAVFAVLDRRDRSQRLLVALTLLLSYWALLAVADSSAPGTTRYIYPSTVFGALVVVELLHLFGLKRDLVSSVVVVAAAALFIIPGLPSVSRYSSERRAQAVELRGALSGHELARAPGQNQLADLLEPALRSDLYLRSIERLKSSPAYPLDRLGGAPPSARAAADRAIVMGDQISVAKSGRASPSVRPTVDAATGAVGERGACLLVSPSSPGGSAVALTPRSRKLTIESLGGSIAVSLRRFNAEFPTARVGLVAAGAKGKLILPADRSSQPWHVRLAGHGRYVVCGAGSD